MIDDVERLGPPDELAFRSSREADSVAVGNEPLTASVAERTGLRSLLSGGAVLALAMTFANGGNYLLNLLLGRWLSPAEFADANLMVTLMLLVTAIAVALQLISARYAGIHQARGDDARADAIATWLRRRALIVGLLLMAALAVPAGFWSTTFRTSSALPFVILAVGMPCYLLQAVGRGMLQGRLRFARLAVTFVVEMIVRVGVALTLVAAGLGVEGATIGLTVSFIATWAIVAALAPSTTTAGPGPRELAAMRTYAAPVGVLLLGQIVINNGDVLVAKRFFEADMAGIYAAIALMGRAVFFLSWSAVTALFPAVAQREESGEESGGLLLGGLAVVGASCAFMTTAAFVGGDLFLTRMLGSEYGGVGNLLGKYAIATSLFALSNLIVSHHLSAGRRTEAFVLLAGGAVQTALLLAFHESMSRVIDVQLVAMGLLLAVLLGITFGDSAARTRTRVAA